MTSCTNKKYNLDGSCEDTDFTSPLKRPTTTDPTLSPTAGVGPGAGPGAASWKKEMDLLVVSASVAH